MLTEGIEHDVQTWLGAVIKQVTQAQYEWFVAGIVTVVTIERQHARDERRPPLDTIEMLQLMYGAPSADAVRGRELVNV